MSRYAQARARAGLITPDLDTELQDDVWDSERQAATDFVSDSTVVKLPAPPPPKELPLPAIDAAPVARRPAPAIDQPTVVVASPAPVVPPPVSVAPPAAPLAPPRTSAAPTVAARAAKTPERPANPEPRIPNPRTSNPDPRIPNPDLRTPNPQPRTANPRTPNPAPRIPNPDLRTPNPDPRIPDAVRRDLGPLVERVFMSASRPPVRSLLLCTMNAPIGDVASQTADLLAAETGRRVALVEDGSTTTRRPRAAAGSLVTRIGWYPPEAASSGSQTGRSTPAVDPRANRGNGAGTDVLGEHVSDLFNAFDFAIVAAAAANAEDLVPLAREVDAVVVIVTAGSTRRDEARALADALRSGRANVLGAVLVGEGKRAK
jgi:hypothetical protein